MSQNKPNLFSIVVNEQSTKYKVWSINYACILHLLFHLVDDNQSLGVDLCPWHVRLCWLQETPAMFGCGKGIWLFALVITRIQETPAMFGCGNGTWLFALVMRGIQETPAMFVCGKGIGLFTFVITRIQETPAIWGLESCTWGGFWWFKEKDEKISTMQRWYFTLGCLLSSSCHCWQRDNLRPNGFRDT